MISKQTPSTVVCLFTMRQTHYFFAFLIARMYVYNLCMLHVLSSIHLFLIIFSFLFQNNLINKNNISIFNFLAKSCQLDVSEQNIGYSTFSKK